MAITDIAKLCAVVSNFGAAQNWQFKSTPVIAWEFGTLSDFHCAKMELMRMISAEPYYIMIAGKAPTQLYRTIDSTTVEIDCYGVVFRLTCNQRLMTERGEVGATEVTPTVIPDGFWSGLQRLRKGGGGY